MRAENAARIADFNLTLTDHSQRGRVAIKADQLCRIAVVIFESRFFLLGLSR